MKKATFDSNGIPTAFYETSIHSDAIPDDAVDITDKQYQELIDNQGRRKFNGGKVEIFNPPERKVSDVVASHKSSFNQIKTEALAYINKIDEATNATHKKTRLGNEINKILGDDTMTKEQKTAAVNAVNW